MSTKSDNPTAAATDAERRAAALAILRETGGITLAEGRAAGIVTTTDNAGNEYVPHGAAALAALADAFRNGRTNPAGRNAKTGNPAFPPVGRADRGVIVRGKDDAGNPTVNVNPRDAETAAALAAMVGNPTDAAAWVGNAADADDAAARLAAVGKVYHMAYSATRAD